MGKLHLVVFSHLKKRGGGFDRAPGTNESDSHGRSPVRFEKDFTLLDSYRHGSEEKQRTASITEKMRIIYQQQHGDSATICGPLPSPEVFSVRPPSKISIPNLFALMVFGA